MQAYFKQGRVLMKVEMRLFNSYSSLVKRGRDLLGIESTQVCQYFCENLDLNFMRFLLILQARKARYN